MTPTIPRFLKAQSLPEEFVLSRSLGTACAPKDFDWLRTSIPCQAACPAGTDIPGYLEAVARGDFAGAYRINLADNVFPAVLGRVCTRPCEPPCRHGREALGEPVAICASKRAAGDFDPSGEPVVLEPIFPPTGKTVAVIGAGAAGLAAARDLALLGHQVTVYEKHPQPGGLMIQGIPAFRLPRELVEREIEQVRRCGVTIACGVEVGKDVALSELLDRYDAMILSSGALKPSLPGLPGEDREGVAHGLPFLMAANRGEAPAVGKRVVVIGGGFTAVDCARMARRLGAESVTVFYRRTEQEMYISGHEIEAMREEGVAFEARTAPLAFEGSDGRLESVRLVRTQPGKAEEDGRVSWLPIEDSAFTVPADTVLLGTGQQIDFSWLEPEQASTLLDEEGRLKLVDGMRTAADRLFVVGDAAQGSGSLIDAIGHARKAARIVDAVLTGEERRVDAVDITNADTTGRSLDLNEVPRQPVPMVDARARDLHTEVDLGLNRKTAATEAGRCYLCHYKFEIDNNLCIYCDRCLKVMPVESCILKTKALHHDEDGRITGLREARSSREYNLLFIDQDACIRCGACMDVCPVDCISLQKVRLTTLPKPPLQHAEQTA